MAFIRDVIALAPWACVFVVCVGAAAPQCASAAGPEMRAIPPEAREVAGEVAELAGAIEDLDEEDQQEIYKLSVELGRAEGSAGYYAMQEKWETISSADVRRQFIEMYGNSRLGEGRNRLHKRLIECMHLAVKDPAPLVQVAGLRVVKQISLKDFAQDFSGYDAWYASVKGKDANEILAATAEQWVKDAAKAKGTEVRKVVDFFEEAGQLMMEIDASRTAAMKAGWAKMLVSWLTADDLSAQAAMRLSTSVKFRKRELQDYILPLIRKDGGGSISVRCWAIALLGDSRASWACDELLKVLRESFEKQSDLRAMLAPMSRALASIGEARAIPVLIGAAEAEGSPAAINTVGQYGLTPLTGVKQLEERDLAWWRDWWQRNRNRYGEAASKLDVPSLLTEEQRAEKEKADAAEKARAAAEAELKAIPAATVSANYDNDQRYNLIGYRPGKGEPDGGFKLLLIFAADGSAEHKAWCQKLWRDALDDTWIVAQVLPPPWDAEPAEKGAARFAWSTKGAAAKGARLTAEDLAAAIVADVKNRCELNSKQIYVLGWGAGGHAAYALTLMKKQDVPLAGTIAAMSEFKPEQTDGLGSVKGRKILILHSGTDDKVPAKHATEAFESLSKSGAVAKLQMYDGGHGWRSDAAATIKGAIEWLREGK